jgi:hypothetical protein
MGPLRRFDFVAPAAHPTGFSIGMMLSSPNNTFVRDLVDNLPKYNRAWFFLPYVTVMFSTGCHYASYVLASTPPPTTTFVAKADFGNVVPSSPFSATAPLSAFSPDLPLFLACTC